MGKLTIDCYNKKIGLKRLASAVYKTLNQTDDLKAELGFVSKEEIKELNRRTRGIDKVTDVLSFPTLNDITDKVLSAKDYPADLDGSDLFLGSIVLCEDRVREQAEELGHSYKRESEYLIIHGLMHLFGYDHMTEQDKKIMRQKEKSALAELGIKE